MEFYILNLLNSGTLYTLLKHSCILKDNECDVDLILSNHNNILSFLLIFNIKGSIFDLILHKINIFIHILVVEFCL